MGLLVVFAFLLIAQFSAVRSGGTELCSIDCQRDRKPICAYNPYKGYRNFPDRCSLQKYIKCNNEYDWRYIHDDNCNQNDADICTLEYRPVCTFSPKYGFKTYPNVCKFSIENTCNTGDYEIVNFGVCEYEGLNNCSIVCRALYDPICGYSSSKGFQTFSNECYMKIENSCKKGDYTLAFNRACTETELTYCDRSCDRTYNPVCARNSNNEYSIFSNPCLLSVANKCDLAGYSFVRYGTCTTQELNGSCRYFCPLYFQPICAFSRFKGFWTFNNQCLMEKENNCYQSGYRVVRQGSCKGTEIGQCNRVCPLTPNKVCGKSPDKGFKSFLNFCVMEAENSCDFQAFDFVHPGDCFSWEYCDNCKKSGIYGNEQIITID